MKNKLTIEEWHSFVIGWGQGMSFWCRNRFTMPMDYDNPLVHEYHYYIVGYGLGVWTPPMIIMASMIGGIKWLLM